MLRRYVRPVDLEHVRTFCTYCPKLCRHACPQNDRGFVLTERGYL